MYVEFLSYLVKKITYGFKEWSYPKNNVNIRCIRYHI